MSQQLLDTIQATVQRLGYDTARHPPSIHNPVDLFTVFIDEAEDAEAEGRARREMAVFFIPVGEELDGSAFLQFLYQLATPVPAEQVQAVHAALNEVNRQLPLGHFATTAGDALVYYKYVLAFPTQAAVSAAHFADILDMAIFSIGRMEDTLAELIKPA